MATSNALIVIAAACDPLVNLDAESLEPGPGLVQSWKFAAEARMVTLQLRKGLRFQDGRPFSAQAVADSLSRVADPATKSPWVSLISSIGSIRVTGPDSLEIDLVRQDADLAALLAHPALTPVAMRPDGIPVCVGPYRVETAPDGTLNLTAFETYRPGTVSAVSRGHVEEILLRQYENPDLAFEALKRGEVDLAPIPEIRIAKQEADGIGRESAPGNSVTYLAFNPTRPETAHPSFRRAISLALNRLAIIDVGFADERLTLSGWKAGGENAPRSKCREAAPRGSDPEAAVQQLAESGVAPGLVLPIFFDQARLTRIVANSIEVQVKNTIGIAFRSEPTDASGVEFSLRGGATAGAWLLHAETDSPIPGRLLSRLFETGSPANLIGYSDPVLDGALVAARAKVDPKKRLPSYVDAEDIACGQMVGIPLWSGVKHWGFNAPSVAFDGPALDGSGEPILRHVKTQ